MWTHLFEKFPGRVVTRGRIRSWRQRHVDVHAWLCPSCDIWDDEATGD
jgi:hypothetical protein